LKTKKKETNLFKTLHINNKYNKKIII
jgi:hypothetical protein